MNFIPPKGWTVYGGADGCDAIPDANGYVFWADNMWQTDKNRNDTWQFIVCRQKNNISEIMPLPEMPLKGAGRIHWTPAGLYASVSCNTPNGIVNKTFLVNQYVQFVSTIPPIIQSVSTAVVAVDLQARQDASVSLQEARRALELARSTQIPPEAHILALIDARLIRFLLALERSDRSDPINTRWMDVLFKKTNDWIFGWMRDNNKL